MSATRLTIVTFIGLSAVFLLVGGTGAYFLKSTVRQTVYELQLANSAEYGTRFAASLEAQVNAGMDESTVLRQFQQTLLAYPADRHRFICIMSDEAEVLCHPNEEILGNRADSLSLAPVEGGMALSFPEWVLDGETEGFMVGVDGRPTQLVRRIPVHGAPWSVLVHTRMEALEDATAKLNGSLLAILLPTGLLTVLAGTLVVRLIGRRHETEIERANALLEERVSERTAELRRTVEELHETRNALLLKEKVALLGTLVAGIAHEIRNPLGAIQLISESLSEYEEDPDVRDGLKKIHSSARRCNKLVANLLSFARNEPPKRVPSSINDLLESALALSGPQLRRRDITVAKKLAAGIPSISVDPIQLEQVFLNLLTNAAQELEQRPEPRHLLVESRVEGATVCIAVEDNGGGVPVRIRERLFEPFQTTKGVGEGTGLGLSLCKRFIDHHGGGIVYTEGGEGGARFEITLPIGGNGSDTSVIHAGGAEDERVVL